MGLRLPLGLLPQVGLKLETTLSTSITLITPMSKHASPLLSTRLISLYFCDLSVIYLECLYLENILIALEMGDWQTEAQA